MAGKIPQSFIDDLISRVDIVEVIDARVRLKKAGKNYQALCPFHNEKSPSFSVNPQKQFYYCFGCGAGGNALGFVMEHDRLDFVEAVELLASNAGLDVPREEGGFAKNQQNTSMYKRLYEHMDGVAAFYTEQLFQHTHKQQAQDYLQYRGLSETTVNQFGIGYAPSGWDHLLNKYLAGSGEKREAAKKDFIELGLVKESEKEKQKHDVYDFFRDRIMFPVRDARGRVVAFGGRVLGDQKPKYLNSAETPIFHKSKELYGLYEAKKFAKNLTSLIVVEGYMDVVMLAQHGVDNAVATLGTATSADHIDKMLRLVKEIVFCFDGDQAGRNAAKKALEVCLPKVQDGHQIKFLFLSEGEDPDSIVQKSGKEGFLKLVRDAQTFSEYLIGVHRQGLDLTTLDGKANFSNEVTPVIQQLQESVLKQLLMQEVAQLTGLDSATIAALGQTTQQEDEYVQTSDAGYSAPSQTRSAGQMYPSVQAEVAVKQGIALWAPVKQAIYILLTRPSLAETVDEPEFLKQLEGPFEQLLGELIAFFKQHEGYNIGHVMGAWADHPNFLLLQQLGSETPPKVLSNEVSTFENAIKLLRMQSMQAEYEHLKHKSAIAGQLTSEEKQRFMALMREISHPSFAAKLKKQ